MEQNNERPTGGGDQQSKANEHQEPIAAPSADAAHVERQGQQAAKPRKPRNDAARAFFWDLKFSTLWQAVFSLALFSVGFSQLIVYLRQAGIMDKQSQIAKSQQSDSRAVQRAFVFFDSAEINEAIDSRTIALPVKNTSEVSILVWWKNSGSTPTKDLDIKIVCGTFAQPIESQFDWKTLHDTDLLKVEGHVSRVLGPQQRAVGGSCRAPPDIWDKLIHRPTVYVIGIATYKDVFDPTTQHVTRMCEFGQLAGDAYHAPPGVTLNDPSLCPGNNNCADEECDKK